MNSFDYDWYNVSDQASMALPFNDSVFLTVIYLTVIHGCIKITAQKRESISY